MLAMAKQPKDAPRKRHTIFVTLDDVTEAKLERFRARQRIKPDRAAVALTALIEFLDREEKSPKKD